MKQIANCDSNKLLIGFSLFLLLAMLKMFDHDMTFIQNILLRFPGRLIFGIAKSFKLKLHVAFPITFSDFIRIALLVAELFMNLIYANYVGVS